MFVCSRFAGRFQFTKTRLKRVKKFHRRFFHGHRRVTIANLDAIDQTLIRNIGIIAHIDAGKTTTTERMLYISGETSSMGSVDSGDTVTDYMDQERERGITITSAAICFDWKNHRINLIDTPGHVDFTVEVERCIRVLDGAVTVLDSSAGVEAQTLTVWRQAKRYHLPTVFYLNKMDKPRASLSKSLESIEVRLQVQPLLLFYPVFDVDSKRISGVVDLLSFRKLIWSADSDGRKWTDTLLTEKDNFFERCAAARESALNVLSDVDDRFADTVIEKASLNDLCVDTEIKPAIRRATLSERCAPVCCGSALKNVAVAPLLDMITDYLPSPKEKPGYVKSDNFKALAFKVTHEAKLGALTHIRIYSGKLKAGDRIFNINREIAEEVPKVFLPHSDEIQTMDSVNAGHIAVLAGLHQTVTGDTLVRGKSHKGKVKIDKITEAALLGIELPEPVYFCSVEPPSLKDTDRFHEALRQLSREDPSLRVRNDAETFQTILEGMGELHIDIIKERLKREWKLDVFLGKLQVAYREKPEQTGEHTMTLEEMQMENRHTVTIGLRAEPCPNSCSKLKELKFQFQGGDRSLSLLRADWLQSILQGCQNMCLNGPLIGYPVQDVQVTLMHFEANKRVSNAFISAVANKCLGEALRKAGTVVFEPIMNIEITVEGEMADGQITNAIRELNQRRAELQGIQGAENAGGWKRVCATAPLSELTGFSSKMRQLTSGLAALHMEPSGYRQLNDTERTNVLNRLRGY